MNYMYATSLVNLILLDYVTLIIFGGLIYEGPRYELFSSFLLIPLSLEEI
jgi:hypothetical protein